MPWNEVTTVNLRAKFVRLASIERGTSLRVYHRVLRCLT